MRILKATAALRRVAAVGAVAALSFGFGASPAFAAPTGGGTTFSSTASAQAFKISLGGAPLQPTPCTATNDGTTTTMTGSCMPPITGPDTMGVLTAGALAQNAMANQTLTASLPGGGSSACAGLLGGSGIITIGANGKCTFANATPPGSCVPGMEGNGVCINLGNALVLRAKALLESCTANADGSTTAQANLVGAQIGSIVLGQFVPLVTLPSVNVQPNTGIPVSGLTVLLNAQQKPGDDLLTGKSLGAGTVSAQALHIQVGGVGGLIVDVGRVTCGPNAAIAASPIVSAKSAPIALGSASLAAVGILVWYRRRRRHAENSI
ncbi:MAG: hypothetical protein ACR2MN_01190 [Acidimicrobiales bacterium]